ncbi:hypothetical protein B0H19DRAFT_1202286 [Mycena capillaripes]|nr:hypothetical protein B0H19DRAFT_1202286 [Mycena capillaripes]
MSSNDNDDDHMQEIRQGKKRRVERACDVCRRRKSVSFCAWFRRSLVAKLVSFGPELPLSAAKYLPGFNSRSGGSSLRRERRCGSHGPD